MVQCAQWQNMAKKFAEIPNGGLDLFAAESEAKMFTKKTSGSSL